MYIEKARFGEIAYWFLRLGDVATHQSRKTSSLRAIKSQEM